MNKNESNRVKEIDRMILTELIKKLEIRRDSVGIINKEEIEKIFQKIDERKRVIFLLFQGNFSVNEKNISDRMETCKQQLTSYDKIANNIISKRVEKIFNRMMSLHEQDSRTIYVCTDRKLFIQRILLENVQESFVKKYVEKGETEIDNQNSIDRGY